MEIGTNLALVLGEVAVFIFLGFLMWLSKK